MKTEVPMCKRCCFCLPLRQGLLVWGYIKLIADLYILAILAYLLVIIIAFKVFEVEFACLIIAIAIFLIDFALTIVFVVGVHKKIVKYLRLFYILSIVMLAITLLLMIAYIGLVASFPWYSSTAELWEHYIKVYSSFFLVLVVQIYFILLLRSEIIKLKNSRKFRFVNNTAEALCSMECEVPAAAEAAEGRQ
ncbi:uncharacterized protein LOC111356667 [Spodoptera litura]|uniref:Uncharacterized protein LOC111356667 n=1 Tax=Spodoptera litura TaxID=69820 RepID=A0A9J7ISZ7_SPOLT|nr:uncharacterized protein LOC111356667 [Spodoptera litura]